jgi:FMN phosphatase YigB (HAD superfamily)
VLGFSSFSHYWNPVEIYAILVLLEQDNHFIKVHPKAAVIEARSTWAALVKLDRAAHSASRSGFLSDKDFFEALLNGHEDKDRLKAFAEHVKRILPDPIFREAQQAYRQNLAWKPLEEAIHFLQRLQESDFLFYLVTEGVTAVQLEKVSLLGLQQFFNGRILVTQAAAEPREAEEIFQAAQNIVSERGQLPAGEESRLDYLTLAYFHGLLRKWADKCNRQFYARALHAVRLDPAAPQERLREVEVLSREEWLARPAIKLAMIGDRYDKDLLPVLELCGKENSITLRVRQGKYRHMSHPEQSESWRSPTASFEEFSQVEAFVFDPKNWEAIGPAPWPKIFDEPRSVQSAIYIERAKKMDMPSVQKLARVLEHEQKSF